MSMQEIEHGWVVVTLKTPTALGQYIAGKLSEIQQRQFHTPNDWVTTHYHKKTPLDDDSGATHRGI